MSIQLPERDCGTCTECCKGYLTGNAHGYYFSKDNPCHFLDDQRCGGGCTIYENRPEICSGFQCVWLREKIMFPHWLRPDKSKVIITYREADYKEDKIAWWSAVECGEKMDSVVLSWLVQNSIVKKINLQYQLNGHYYYLGSDEFYEYMSQVNVIQ